MMPGVDPWEKSPQETGKLSAEYIRARRQVKYRRYHDQQHERIYSAYGVGISPLGVIIMSTRSTRLLIPWSHVMEFMYSNDDTEAKRVIGETQ
jgi:hypothetical protein